PAAGLAGRVSRDGAWVGPGLRSDGTAGSRTNSRRGHFQPGDSRRRNSRQARRMNAGETATLKDMAPRAALVEGMRRAAGVPMIVLAASYLGFGVLCRESGLTLDQSVLSTATGWALPGQIALVEMYAVGSSWLAIVLA